MSDHKIEIKNLYKIFGPNGKEMVKHVKNGVGKTELLDKYGHVLGLCDININIAARGIQVVMGLSGSGKSTLIRHINRLIEPTDGELLVDGENVLSYSTEQLREFRRHKASMVFQKFGLFPHRTVIENVAYGLTVQKIDEDEAKKRSQKWIDRVGLGGFEDRFPSQLSGGMQQRVGLARALATDADILLMDEAFSALDPLIRTDMQNVLLDLQTELHKTVVFITHDLDEALRIGDQIAILRDGVIVQQGEPQNIILSPADDYVTDFIKDINRVRVLEVGSIMDEKVPKKGPQIEKTEVIENALQVLVKEKSDSAIVVDNGKQVGSVTMENMIKAIARQKGSEAGTDIYK